MEKRKVLPKEGLARVHYNRYIGNGRMILFRCPGQDMRNLTVSYHPCPKCGKPVEFFSDEMRIRCPHCKTMVHKEQAPSCIQWCKAARDCLGPELYDQIIGKLKEQTEEKE